MNVLKKNMMIIENGDRINVYLSPSDTSNPVQCDEGGIIFLQWVNALSSAVLDNIPVASVMTTVMDKLLLDYPAIPFNPLLVSVVIGTNLGGNITPIGSASTVQAVSSLNRLDNPQYKVTFLEFVKFGGITSILQLIIGSFYIIGLWLFSI